MQQTKEQGSAITELDASGLRCPMPVLRANRALRDVTPGGLLRVRATDPAAQHDFPSFCQTTGHSLVESRQDGDGWVFLLRKKN